MHLYRICGLIVGSELELPGVHPLPSLGKDLAEQDIEVHIRLTAVPRKLQNPSRSNAIWELNDEEFLLRLPEVCRVLARAGRELEMEVEPGCSADDALPFLLGTGLCALLLQRGSLVLHASAVAVNGRAYLFCGDSGQGKSTLAAALCRAGATFVGDDVATITVDADDRPVIWPDGRQLKLFERSIGALQLEPGRGQAVRSMIDKYYVQPPGSACGEPLPVAAVYMLKDAGVVQAESLQQLNPINAAQSLLNMNHRLRLALALTQSPKRMQVTAALLRHAQVFDLVRHRDLGQLQAGAERLLQGWAQQ